MSRWTKPFEWSDSRRRPIWRSMSAMSPIRTDSCLRLPRMSCITMNISVFSEKASKIWTIRLEDSAFTKFEIRSITRFSRKNDFFSWNQISTPEISVIEGLERELFFCAAMLDSIDIGSVPFSELVEDFEASRERAASDENARVAASVKAIGKLHLLFVRHFFKSKIIYLIIYI